jgi:cytoskeletal protein CcmA (bactofilin family)
MFSEKKDKVTSDSRSQQNKISEGTVITGDISSEGDFRIDGVVKGNLKSSGKVVVGKTGIIEGHLTSSNADIEGKILGEVYVKDLLSLRATAVINGKVEISKLSVEPGATFNASCEMKGAIPLNNGNKSKKQEQTA